MSFGSTRTAAFYDGEIFKIITGSEAAMSATLDGTRVPLDSNGRRIIKRGTVMVYVGTDEVEVWTVNGGPTGGTFAASLNGGAFVTGNIQRNATAADIKAAINAVAGTDTAKTVTGSAGGPWTITYGGVLGGRDVTSTTFNNAGLTGGSSPTVTAATNTAGGANPAKGQKIMPAPSSGITSASIAGILQSNYEAFPETPKAYENDRAVAVWQLNCNFDATKLTSYTNNASAVKAAMTGAGNGECANCTFR